MNFRVNPTHREHAISLAVLATASFILYFDYWLGAKVFSGKDFLTAFYPLLNFQTDCLQGGSWPLWNPFMNFGYPYVEHYVNSALFPTHLFMGLVTGSSLFLIQRELLFWILVGGFGIYLCVREFGLRSTTGIIAGISFMGCGQLIALPQWSTLVYNAACFPYLILGYHRAKRLDSAFHPLSLTFMTFTIYGGYIVTTVLGIYLFGTYVVIDAALSRKPLFGVRYLGITIALAVALTLPKLLPLYAGMGAGPRLAYSPPGDGTLETFNIISPYNLLSLLLPVKYYFSLFLGTAGILAIIHSTIRKRLRFSAFAAMTALSGWLLLSGTDGSPSLLRDAASFLPFMRLVRNDWLSWFFPSIFAILFLARPIEELFFENADRSRYIAGAIYATLLTLAFLNAYEKRLYGNAYAFHFGIAAAALFLPSLRKPGLLHAAAVALVLIELTIVWHRINIDASLVRLGDRMQFTIVDQMSISRSYLEDNRIRSVGGERFAMDVTAIDDQLRPTIDEARRQPVLFSGLHGMPSVGYSQVQYGKFIDDMNMKRFSGWWYNTQERYEFIRIKESPLLEDLNGIPLYMFTGRSGRSLPDAVRLTSLSCSSFGFTIDAPEPGILFLMQMFDERWSAYVNGRPAAVHRANDAFMGLGIAQGSSEIVLTFTDKLFTWSVGISLSVLAGIVGWMINLKRIRRRPLP